jgi:hypothetical protein
MAHAITAINAQANLALEALDDAPEQAREALSAIRTSSREAMAEIRATIGVLRQDEGSAAPRTPTPTLDQVDGLISDAERAGVHIDMTISGMA